MMLRRNVGSFLGAVTSILFVGLVAGGPALAQSAEQQVLERKENYKQLGGATKTLSTFVKGEGGTQDDARKAAATLVDLGGKMHGWFPEGTAIGVGKSEAKPLIWTEMDKFKEKITALNAATPQLVAAVDTGDTGAIGKQLGAVGGTCKACHETYREKD